MHEKTNLDDETGILELLMREATTRPATVQDAREGRD
jgi:hypothetical protein